MSIRRVVTLAIQRDLPLLTVPLFSLWMPIMWGFITRTAQETRILSLYHLFLNLLPPVVVAMVAMGCMGSIIDERRKRTGECLFATPVTPLEYLASKWMVGFMASALNSYLSMGLFVIVAGVKYLKFVPNIVWLMPSLMGLSGASVGVLIAVVLGMSSWVKKILISLVIFVPQILIFGVEIAFVSATGRPFSALSPLARWLGASLYSVLCLLVLGRKLEVRAFVS